MNKTTPVIQNGKIIGHVRSWKQATKLLGGNAKFERRLGVFCYTDK